MKKLMILLFSLLMIIPTLGISQIQEKITVNASDLTPDQLAKVKAEQELKLMQEKMKTYGNWVGVGGEVGLAVKEGLNAVVDVSAKFGGTSVGKFTMFLIAWKVVGVDIIRIIIGLTFIIIFIIFLTNAYKKEFISYKILKENPGFFKYPKIYEVIDRSNYVYDGIGFVKFMYLLMIPGAFGITYAIMFA